MTEPITRDEDGDILYEFSVRFRDAVAWHTRGRLDLFFRLQFPDAENHVPDRDDTFHRLDIFTVIDDAIPSDVADHPLTATLRVRMGRLLDEATEALALSASEDLQPARFLRLTAAMRKLDIAINHFNASLAASLSDVDELTGLLNRAALDRDIGREVAQSRRTGIPFSVAILDADHFKHVNDDHGHAFGDFVLEELAERLEDSLRPRDRVYRYGGEEFLVLLPETPLDEAVRAVERLRKAVCAEPIADGTALAHQTISAGVAEVSADEGADAVLERADKALYKAKEDGRNRVVASRARNGDGRNG